MISYKDVLPPFLYYYLKGKFGHKWFSGIYASWEEAKKYATGYNDQEILNQVTNAALMVKNGQASFERDSVTFNNPDYNYKLLTILLIAYVEDNYLSLVDFGGSLGSTYYQHKKILSCISEFQWIIIEQEKFVQVGKSNFEDEHLSFNFTIDDIFLSENPNLILLSSVLQYIEKPYEQLSKIIQKKVKYIVLDRTPFIDFSDDIISVQNVPSSICKSSYPAWFFNKNKLVSFFLKDYELFIDTDSFESWRVNNQRVKNKFLVFKRK